METIIDKTTLRSVLIDQIPEARHTLSALPGEASVYTLLHKLAEVTSMLAHQNRFKAVKRCLTLADSLLRDGDKSVSTAVCTVYVHYLSILLDRRDACADVIHYMLPRTLRAEYNRQINACLP